uniref:Uncharacterized protein n=1 Tax=Panstrongylus lignarius TaxID=156445 RepID=A0A224XUN7_9HEMI
MSLFRFCALNCSLARSLPSLSTSESVLFTGCNDNCLSLFSISNSSLIYLECTDRSMSVTKLAIVYSSNVAYIVFRVKCTHTTPRGGTACSVHTCGVWVDNVHWFTWELHLQPVRLTLNSGYLSVPPLYTLSPRSIIHQQTLPPPPATVHTIPVVVTHQTRMYKQKRNGNFRKQL